MQIVNVILLIALFLSLMYVQSMETFSSAEQPAATLNNFKVIVREFNCKKSATFFHSLKNTNKFTMSAVVKINDYSNDPKVYQKLFHGGNRTGDAAFGLWIRNGFFRLTSGNGASCPCPDDEDPTKVPFQLERDTVYTVALVYNVNETMVYIDGNLVHTYKNMINMVPTGDLFVGKNEIDRNGADVDLTICYLSTILDADFIQKYWLNMKTMSSYRVCDMHKHFTNFRTIVKNFNCQGSVKFDNALSATNTFTMSAILCVKDYVEGMQELFHAGNITAVNRTPGVWLNNGFLHVRATTTLVSNDGGVECWKIGSQLQKGETYSVVLVYDRNQIRVFVDGIKVQSCSLTGDIIPFTNLYVGSNSAYPNGPDVDLTLSYLPMALDDDTIIKCWSGIQYQVKCPVPVNCKYTYNYGGCEEGSIYIQNCNGKYLVADSSQETPSWTATPSPACCFRLVPPIFQGVYPSNSYSIESTALQSYYLRHSGYVTRLSSTTPDEKHREEFVFQVVPGINGQSGTITIKPVQDQLKNSCFYSDASIMKFKKCYCPQNDELFANTASFNTGVESDKIFNQ